ncbi:MAG: hypothetical protein Q8898_10910 [Bacillota bacterium]|nr:hypothetical protein [Bacillota bacterium]
MKNGIKESVVASLLVSSAFFPFINSTVSADAKPSSPHSVLPMNVGKINFQSLRGKPLVDEDQDLTYKAKKIYNGPSKDKTSKWEQLGNGPIMETGQNQSRSDSGRVTSIAIAESKKGKTLYLGSAGGVWSSSNEGSSWTPLTDDQVSLSTGSVTVDPNNKDILYVGTGEQNFSNDSRYGEGVLKSTDSGKTWIVLGADIFAGQHIGKVAVDPHNSSALWVAADKGLFYSNDGGSTWVRSLGWTVTRGGAPKRCNDVYVDVNNPGTVYASFTRYGLWKSTDNGETWNLLGNQQDGTGLPVWRYFFNMKMYRASMAVVEGTNSSEDTIYTNFSDDTGESMGFFVSKDGGGTWTELNNVPPYLDSQFSYTGTFDPTNAFGQGFYDNVIAVDPTNKNHILAGGITLVESKDGGNTWRVLDFFDQQAPQVANLHPDQHAIIFDSKGNAYIGNDGGIFVETKDGNWENLNTNLQTATFNPGISVMDNGEAVFAGAQDNGTSLLKGESKWNQKLDGDGGYTYLDPKNGRTMFAETEGGRIQRSIDGGKTWNQAMPNYLNPYSVPFLTPFVVQPDSKNPSYHDVRVGGDRVYRSTDDGMSYTDISPQFLYNDYIFDTITAISQSPTNPDVIYVGTLYGQVYATFDGGGKYKDHWKLITPFNGDYTYGADPLANVSSIAINPKNDKEVTVVYGSPGYWEPNHYGNNNHVFYNQDTTSNLVDWLNISDNLPISYVDSATYIGNAVVVGTEQGVYMAPSGTSNWAKLGAGLPNVTVTSLVYTGKE